MATVSLVWSGAAKPVDKQMAQPAASLNSKPASDPEIEMRPVDYDCNKFYEDVPTIVKNVGLGGSHVLGQILGAQAWRSSAPNVSSLEDGGIVPLLRANSMIASALGTKIGLYHASVWYIVGVSPNLSFDDYEKLCPWPDYEWVFMCFHGVGHAGMIRKRKEDWTEYSACADVGVVPKDYLEPAYAVCKGAPSTMIEFSCAMGFYHVVFEHLDPDSGEDPYFPCIGTDYPHKHGCFMTLFLVHAQSLSDAGTGDVVQRRAPMVASRGEGGRFCSGLAEQDTLNCIWGLATQMHFNGDGPLFNRYAKTTWGLTLNTTWVMYIPVPGGDNYMDLSAEDIGRNILAACHKVTPGPQANFAQWRACLSGSFGFWVSHIMRYRPMAMADRKRICTPFLKEVPGATEAYLSHLTCMKSIKVGYHTFIKHDDCPDEKDEFNVFKDARWKASWAYWRTADVHAPELSAFMAPFTDM